MRNLSLKFGILLMGCLSVFSSCSNDKEEPNIDPVETLSGIYTINQGNMAMKVPGSITAYDFASGNATAALEDAFFAKNGVSIGDTPQSAIIYDSKMYIAVYNSNIIWVVNPNTLEILSTIRPDNNSANPRYFAAHNGKVYVSLYTGQIAQIDTKTMTIDKTIQVGPNPEHLAIAGNKLYVACSDGLNYMNGYTDGYISVIDLNTFEETKIKDNKKVLNPVDMLSNGTDVFVICKGNYADVPCMLKKIENPSLDGIKDICEATLMAINGNELYVINSPFGVAQEDITYKVYDTKSCNLLRDMIQQKVESPSAIAVDPLTGDIAISSYTISPSTGYSQYNEPGYVNIYSSEGAYKTNFICGIGTQDIIFVHSYK